MKRIISQTFSVNLDQLERLSDVAARARVSRSSLLRGAIDVVLARYEQPTQVDGRPAASGRKSTATRT
ncbi:MAG: ribbon-helix-helix domain-containing protein [Methyloceanibacter sp.]